MTEGSKAWYLKQINLFKNISDEEMMDIAQSVVEKKCSKKEVLYTPFEDYNYVCILKKGEVTLYHSHNGRKLILETLKPGDIFGNTSFREQKNGHFAEVTKDSLICVIPVAEFLKIIKQKPELMLELIKIMSEKLAEYENRMKNSLLDAKEKIINYLEQNRGHATHEKIGQNTGLTRETVTRSIAMLKREGQV